MWSKLVYSTCSKMKTITSNHFKVLEGDCSKILKEGKVRDVDLTFLDPPYNQGKDYRFFDDKQSEGNYWEFMEGVLDAIFNVTSEGGAIYFMQREKNAEHLLKALRHTNWTFQNLIIWKKKTSAIPGRYRYSKQFQIIAFATKGKKPRLFNRLRIDYPLAHNHKYPRKNGIYVPDVWDDIKELTSGYFAGDEALRDANGNRIHKQQTPVELLLRIILSSSLPDDKILDPFAGTGPALVVAKQLNRKSVGIEIDPQYVNLIKKRLSPLRPSDDITKYLNYYRYTPNLEKIWEHNKRINQSNLI